MALRKLTVALLAALAVPTTFPTPKPLPPVETRVTLTASVDTRAVVKVDVLVLQRGARVEGTAVVIDPSGLLVTANHVIDGADVVSVMLDGRAVVAEIVAREPLADLAMLKIEGSAFPALSVTSTVTPGIHQVWAIGRDGQPRAGKILRIDELGKSIQEITTDAEFHEGDSGGALVNAKGQLIGVLLGVGENGRIAVGVESVKRLLKNAVPLKAR